MKSALHKTSIPGSQIFEVRHLVERHFDPIWHAHSEYQLFVVLQGTGTRFIGDSLKAFNPGELIFTGPHLPHLWRSDESYFDHNSALKTEGIVIYFNENFLGDHFLEKEEMTLLKKLFTRSRRGLEFFGKEKSAVIQKMHELLAPRGIKSVILLLEILEILAGTKNFRFISSREYEEEFNQSETDRMNTVYGYVLKNFRQKIYLSDLGRLLHMTPTSFSRYFTMKTSKPFSKFLSEIRIKHACKLLVESDQSIEQICYECGFSTLSNFNKQFKDMMQKKPSEYKNEFLSI